MLLEAARRHGARFHHISTDEVYGDLALDDPAKFTEENPIIRAALFFSESGVGFSRACMVSYLWHAGDYLARFEQLRTLSAYREVHSTPEYQCFSSIRRSFMEMASVLLIGFMCKTALQVFGRF